MRNTAFALALAALMVLLALPAEAEDDTLNTFSISVLNGEIVNGAYQIETGSVLTATVEKGGTWAEAAVTWESSAPDVAIVYAGTINALSAGECEITATATIEATGENTSAVIKVRVVDPTPVITVVTVRASAGATSVIKGETLQLLADVTPAGVGVTWSSSRPGIIAVDEDGLLTGRKKGRSIITATADDSSGASDSITITVEVEPARITLNRTRLELYTGGTTKKMKGTATLKATIKPAGADQSVTWRSSDTDVVIVGAKGKVTAVKKGTANIIATTSNGIRARCTVQVSKLPTIVWLPALKKVYEGRKLDLGDLLRINGDVTSVTWKTSNANIATVNQKGVVTGISTGQCKITVRAVNGRKDVCVINVYASSKSGDDVELADDPGIYDDMPTDEELAAD
ncbi:MAG: Ig-like domain-containing protein [Clostridia bacterium]|nr:Ig-like domain-containing protein [Clostridia bacterium]